MFEHTNIQIYYNFQRTFMKTNENCKKYGTGDWYKCYYTTERQSIVTITGVTYNVGQIQLKRRIKHRSIAKLTLAIYLFINKRKC